MPKKSKRQQETGLVEVKITTGRDLTGKRLQKSFYGKSKQEARRKAQEYLIEQEAALQTGKAFIKKSYTFEEWALKWLEIYKKPHTTPNGYAWTFQNTVRKHLIPYFGNTELTSIRNADIQAFFASKTSYSESMLNKMRMCLSGIFETAIDNDLCFKNPVKNVVYKSAKGKNTKHILTPEQAEIVKQFARGRMDEVVLLLETGLRRGELLGLRWEDIDLDKQFLKVNRSVADSREKGRRVTVGPPKWNSVREIPLLSNSLAVLSAREPNSPYIFPAADGQPQNPNTWSQKLGGLMAQLHREYPEIPLLTAHELRHSYGTILRRKGVDIYTIQKVMGHKDIKMTTEIYVHNETDVLKEAIQKVF